MSVNFVKIGDVIKADSSWVIEKIHGSTKDIFMSVSQSVEGYPMLKEWWFKADISNAEVQKVIGEDGTGMIGRKFVVVSAGMPHGENSTSAGHAMEGNPAPYVVRARLLTESHRLSKPPLTIVFNQNTRDDLYRMDNPKVIGSMSMKVKHKLGFFLYKK
ncbi:MAG: hypothetical protein COB76_05250 [Alphaproteobacteria bacterium]|nr:MAG: hypothetical protein COB76_05250 [Alphaproteobacteria bacterium]